MDMPAWSPPVLLPAYGTCNATFQQSGANLFPSLCLPPALGHESCIFVFVHPHCLPWLVLLEPEQQLCHCSRALCDQAEDAPCLEGLNDGPTEV